MSTPARAVRPDPSLPPGFTLDADPSLPAGFSLDAPSLAAAGPPPGFTLDPAPGGPSPGFQLDELQRGDPGWITVPEEPPIGAGEVLLDSLGQTAQEWGDVFAGLPEKLTGSMGSTIANVRALSAGGRALAFEDFAKQYEELGRPDLAEGMRERVAAQLTTLEDEQAYASDYAQQMAPTEGATMAQGALEQAAVSAVPSAVAMLTGLVTRNPAIAAATMQPTSAAAGFGDLLGQLDARAAQEERETLRPRTQEERFGDIERAIGGGMREGDLEVLTEVLPFGKILKRGTPAVQRLAEVLLAELPGETLASLTQAINRELALQPEGEAPLDAVFAGLEEGGREIPQTLLSTIIGSAGQTAPIAAAEAVAARLNRKPQETPGAPTPDGAPEAAAEDVDVEGRAARAFGDELGEPPPSQAEPEAARAPAARTPSDAWRADPEAAEGVPFAFLGETPEVAAGYLVESNGKIQAVTAAGDVVGEFDGPDEAAIALEDAVGAVQTPAQPAQGFGEELAELGGAPIPAEPVAGEVVAPEGLAQFGGADRGQNLAEPALRDSRQVIPVPEADRERRRNRNKPVAEMNEAELRQTLLTHELTGIPNRRAYEEAPKLPSQTAVDVDSLKWVNDNMGHDAGNELLRAVGEAIRAETDQAYHLSGDEFAIQAASDEEAAAIMQRVNDRLAGAVISVTMPDGTVHTLSGMGVSYGSGKDLGAADARLQAHKTEREARGERAGRGEQPPGASRFAAEEGREGDEGAAPAAQGQQEPDVAGAERITLAGRFAHHERADAEDVSLEGEDPRLGDDLEFADERRGYGGRRSTQELEIAVQRALGGAKNAPDYRFVPADGLPADAQGRMRLAPGFVWKAAFDPVTNKVWLNEDEIRSGPEAAWYAMHEIAGHYGIKGAVGQLGAKDRTRINAALNMVAQNPFIADLAEIYKQDREISYGQALEEALSELAAAIRTNNLARLERVYGLKVPAAYTGEKVDTSKLPAWRRAINRLIETIKSIAKKALGYNVSDEQVLQLLEDAWQYVQSGKKRTAGERRRGDTEVSLADEIESSGKEIEAILNGDVTPAQVEFEKMIATVVNLVERVDSKDIAADFGEKMQQQLREAAVRNLEQLLEQYAERFGKDYFGPNVDKARAILAEEDRRIVMQRPHSTVYAIELRAERGPDNKTKGIKLRLLDAGPWKTKEEAEQHLKENVGEAYRGRVVSMKRFEFEQTVADQYEEQRPDGEPPDLADDRVSEPPVSVRRAGPASMREYGLSEGANTTRQVAGALERRQVTKYGRIDPDDYTPKTRRRIARWMAAEIAHELERPRRSGAGWYSSKFKRAINVLATEFPELKTDKGKRDTMTALIAITSDGNTVSENLRRAVELYRGYRESGKLKGTKGVRGEVATQLGKLEQLIEARGERGAHRFLMKELTVSELKKRAADAGVTFNVEVQADQRMPMSALVFGPKLGAFYANLMGADGYLTMDRWWSRTFNRYRGSLIAKPTQAGLKRFRELLGKPNLTDTQTIEATIAPANAYAEKGYKNGTELEKAANTIYKAAFINLEDTPRNARDRTFMLATAKEAQAELARRGHDVSIADIQAILWYYEKRLYGELGARQSKVVSYEDAARQLLGQERRGGGDRRRRPGLGEDAGAAPARDADGALPGDGVREDRKPARPAGVARVRPARSPARGEEQLELFTKDEARPGTNAKQLALSNELLREWAERAAKGTKKIKTLVAAFDKDFRTDHSASLLGRNLTNADDFALLAQVFRDPRYETLRYFFIDEDGKVIAETGVSARLPGGAQAWPAGSTEQWLVDMFKRTKAAGIRLLHNHPSGNAQWSQADLDITRKIARVLDVDLEHVIVDSNEFSVIRANRLGQLEHSEARVKIVGLGADKMLKPKGKRALKPLLGQTAWGPRDIIRIAAQLGARKEYFSVIALSARHDVRAIGDMRIKGIKNVDELTLALHDFGLQTGSPAIVLAGLQGNELDVNAKTWRKLIQDGYLLDVVDVTGRSFAETDPGAYRGPRTLGKIEALATEELGSAKPFGLESQRGTEERGDRRAPAAAVAENKAQLELGLEAAQRDLDELIERNKPMTETSAFKRWFGKSKVVDEKGRPLVVYHGTQAATDFKAFQETADVGFHFGNAKAAADRLGLYPESKRKVQLKNARVIPVYLSIKNPLRMDDLSDWEGGVVVDELRRLGVIDKDEAEQMRRDLLDVAEGDIAHVDADVFRRVLERKGYDGVVYRNETEGIELRPFDFTIEDVEIRKQPEKAHTWNAYRPDGKFLTSAATEKFLMEKLEDLLEHGDTVETDSWIALRPSQIKSAIGNKGSFDPEAEEIDLAQEKGGGGTQKSGFSGGPGQRYVEMYRYKNAPTAPTRAKVRAEELEIPKEPIRAQHVMELFQRLFKVKIYEGKPFKVRSALGFFRPRNFEVRNKYRNDLEVAAHEVFHWLDRTYPSIRKLYHMRRFADELKGVSYDETKLYEGFAEFGRLFMTQEAEAVERLPTFYEAFVKEARDAGILDKLEEVQRLMHQWYLQGAEARGRSKIGTSKAPLKQRLGAMADGFIDRAIASSLDARQAAKIIERETLGDKAFGDAAMSPYKSIRLLGGLRSTINTWLNYGTLRWTEQGDLERNGPGLKQIFEPISDVFDEAMGYFVALRADELRVHSKENLFTKDETTALIERARKTGKLEQIQRAHAGYQQYTKRLLNFAVQSGILNPATKAVWEELYANYVPFYRVAEKFGTLDPRMAGGTQGGLFRKLTGGTANVADVFENITLNTALVVSASMKNVAMRQLFTAIDRSPKGQRYAVRIGTDTELRKVGIDQIKRVLEDFAKAAADKYHETDEADEATRIEYGQMAMLARKLARRDPDAGQLTMGDVMQQAKFFFTGRPPQIPDKQMVLVKGEPVWFQIGDPLLWDMLVDMNYHEPLGLAERVFGIAKRTLTRGVTVTPEFQIANMLRDTFNAFAMSKGGQLPIVDALKAIRDIWAESPDYVDFLANGGGFGNAIGDEAKRLRVRIHATGHRWLATPIELLEYWDKWGQSFELATRLAEYKRIRAKGGTRREAAFEGREISTDFAMRGHSQLARFASISLPFFNARLQGLYRIERELNERRGRQSPLRGERALSYASKAFMGLTLPSLLVYWFLNRGDDDYEELGEELKSLNTVVPGPDGTQILIPRPFETGALFMEVPVRLLQYAEEKNGEQLVNAMMFMLANTFNFDPKPQLVAPPLRILMNQQWNGLPIVPRSLENVEPREQFQPWTPDSYKRIGEAFNVSPLKLQALVEGYLGTVGTYAVAASDALMQPPDSSGEEVDRRLSQWPLLRRFMREAPYTNTAFESRFYDMLDEVDRVVDTARKLRREAREDDLDAYLSDQERAALFAISGPATDTMELAADLNAQMRAIRNDASLSGEEKLEQILELQEEQNALFRDAMQAFDEAMLEEARRALGGQ